MGPKREVEGVLTLFCDTSLLARFCSPPNNQRLPQNARSHAALGRIWLDIEGSDSLSPSPLGLWPAAKAGTAFFSFYFLHGDAA
jgi:hypothetical protein